DEEVVGRVPPSVEVVGQVPPSTGTMRGGRANTEGRAEIQPLSVMRKKKAEYERVGAKLTYMAFIAKAIVDALRRHPIVNASIDGDNVVYKKDINLGIAVAL